MGYRLMLAMVRDAGRSRIVEVRIALRLSETGEVAEILGRRATATLKDGLRSATFSDSPAAQFGTPELEGISWPESPRDWEILVAVEATPDLLVTRDVVATA